MMKRLHLFGTIVFGLLLITSSCEKNDEQLLAPGDYLIFGHFYGECFGEECIEIFRLEKDKLYEDRNDNYPGYQDFYKGRFDKLPNEKFEKVKNLMVYFPDSLLLEKARVIGQPDAGDWGGVYIEYNYNGARKFWLIDQMKSNVPGYLHGFIDKVNEDISLLSQ